MSFCPMIEFDPQMKALELLYKVTVQKQTLDADVSIF